MRRRCILTGRLSGGATQFQQVANSGFIRVWCGAHQLDIVVQKVYSIFGDEEFYKQLTSLISYLRRQYNLISDMKSKAPTLSDTRWASIHGVSEWFKKNRTQSTRTLQRRILRAFHQTLSGGVQQDSSWQVVGTDHGDRGILFRTYHVL